MFGIEGVQLRVALSGAFLQRPLCVMKRFEPLPDSFACQQEVSHVIGGIAELHGREGPLVPVCESQALADFYAGRFDDELGEGKRVGKADEAGGNLRVEDVGRGAAQMSDNRFKVLLPGMNDLLD